MLEDNTGKVTALIVRKLNAAHICAAEMLADEHEARLRENIEEGPPFVGPHSSEGEYPFHETGNAANSVGYYHIPARVAAGADPVTRVGLAPEGDYVERYLVDRGRLGLEYTLFELEDVIANEFLRCLDAKT